MEYAGLAVPPLVVGDLDRLMLVKRFIKLTADESFFSLIGCAACSAPLEAAAAAPDPFFSAEVPFDLRPNSESM